MGVIHRPECNGDRDVRSRRRPGDCCAAYVFKRDSKVAEGVTDPSGLSVVKRLPSHVVLDDDDLGCRAGGHYDMMASGRNGVKLAPICIPHFLTPEHGHYGAECQERAVRYVVTPASKSGNEKECRNYTGG